MTGSNIGRHSPLGYFNFAGSYLAAANLIADHGLRATHPHAPASFLYYHAIELYFKSILMLRGTAPQKLKKLGHNFRNLRTEAEKHGLQLGDAESEVLDIMCDGDVWGRSRYLETGKLQTPTVEGLRRTSGAVRAWAAHELKAAGHSMRMPSHKKCM